MPSPAELAELHHLIGGLRRCVTSMKTRYGDTPGMNRVVNDADRLLNDLDRLEIDVADLGPARVTSSAPSGERIAVPEGEYDSDFWRDVDDEGVGGYR